MQWCISHLSGTPQLSSRQIQVGECERGEDLRAVLCDAAIANLAVAELAFVNAEDVFDLGAACSGAGVAFLL